MIVNYLCDACVRRVNDPEEFPDYPFNLPCVICGRPAVGAYTESTYHHAATNQVVIKIYTSGTYYFDRDCILAKIIKRVYGADGKLVSQFALNASGEWQPLALIDRLPPECIFELAGTGYAVGQPLPVALATGGKDVV